MWMKVILAQPRGFCAGVVRAIEIVERALQKYGPPVYVRHEIVHNKHVVESLKAKGARLSKTCPKFRLTRSRFSAPMGSPRASRRRRCAGAPGSQRHLPAGHQGAQPGQALCRPGPPPDFDRACRSPRSRRHHGPDFRAGDAGADRKRCRALDIPADTPVAYVTQTTLSVDDTRGIIAAFTAVSPTSSARKRATSATPRRTAQTAVRELSKLVDVILVVGAKNSSNSNRLREIGEEAGTPSYLIADGSEVQAGMVRARQDRRHHGRRVGPRSPGRGRDRRFAPARSGRRQPIDRPPGNHRVPLAAGTDR